MIEATCTNVERNMMPAVCFAPLRPVRETMMFTARDQQGLDGK